MALRVAVATGNWSNPAIWNGGVLPTTGDVVASNNFTVTIDQNVNVDTITNAAQAVVDAVPDMTSYTTPSGVVTASSEVSGFPAWQAFGAGSSLEWRYDNSAWVAYEFPTPKAIDRYYFTGDTTNTAWTLEAWDGSNWIILHSGTNASTYTSPLLGNSTPYIKYRLNITSSGTSRRLREIDLFEYLGTTPANAGGGFILNSGVTATATTVQGNANGTAHCLRYDGSGSATLIGNVLNPFNSGIYRSLYINTTGTFNWTGDLNVFSNSGTGSLATMEIANSGTTNWVGNHNGNHTREPRFYVLLSGTCTLNHTGNLTNTSTGGNNFCLVNVSAGCTYNLTGTANIAQRTNAGYAGIDNFGTTTIIGAVIYYSGLYGGVVNNGNNTLTIIGPITQIDNSGTSSAVVSTSSGAINLLSGPFIFSNYGYNPLRIVRMHLIPSPTSYIEFRDETTNGALSPGAIAPPTQLVSPASVSDGPAVENVRLGTTYALGTLTGTLRMPHPNQVTFGIAVDNTFGTAVLTAASVWDYLVSNITTENSIGMRLKNVSTPQTTGEQLEAFLRLE
jgi:hypothetical protein